MSLHDALVAPVWMAVSVLLVAAAWRAARRALPADSVAESVLHATVLCYACVVGVGIVLGAAGAVRTGPAGRRGDRCSGDARAFPRH